MNSVKKNTYNSDYNGNNRDAVGMELSNIDLSNDDLSATNLKGLKLKNCIVKNVNFTESDLTNAEFIDCDFSGSKFKKCILKNIKITNCDFTKTDLSHSIMINGNIVNGIFNKAYLCSSYLTNSTIKDSKFEYAVMYGSDLAYCDFSGSTLKGANLCYSNLYNANLKDTFLKDILTNERTLFYYPLCPVEGSIVGYTIARDNKLVKLFIPEDAKRSNATTTKCRCDKARVLDITSIDGNKRYNTAENCKDASLKYKMNNYTKVNLFDENRWNCNGEGITFYLSKEECIKNNIFSNYND